MAEQQERARTATKEGDSRRQRIVLRVLQVILTAVGLTTLIVALYGLSTTLSLPMLQPEFIVLFLLLAAAAVTLFAAAALLPTFMRWFDRQPPVVRNLLQAVLWVVYTASFAVSLFVRARSGFDLAFRVVAVGLGAVMSVLYVLAWLHARRTVEK